MSLENHQTVHDDDFTSKSDSKLKDSDILLQNQRRDFSTNSFKSYYKEQNLDALFDDDFLENAKILTPDGRSYALGAHPSVGLDRPSRFVEYLIKKQLTSQDQNENFKDKIMKKFEQGVNERKENTQKALNLDLVKDLKAKPNSSDDLNDKVLGAVSCCYVVWKTIINGPDWTFKLIGLDKDADNVIAQGLANKLEARAVMV